MPSHCSISSAVSAPSETPFLTTIGPLMRKPRTEAMISSLLPSSASSYPPSGMVLMMVFDSFMPGDTQTSILFPIGDLRKQSYMYWINY